MGLHSGDCFLLGNGMANLPSAEFAVESGVLDVTEERDYTVQLRGRFSSPPPVLLTGKGKREHAAACLNASKEHTITRTSFTARLIHQHRSALGHWEIGRVHWVAISPSTSGGVLAIASSGDRTLCFAPFGSEPAVIATGQGIRNHSTACLLPGADALSLPSAKVRLVDCACDRGWETGSLHYFAAGTGRAVWHRASHGKRRLLCESERVLTAASGGALRGGQGWALDCVPAA